MQKSRNVLIGQRLKEARKAMGLRLKAVAERMGFGSYQTLGSMESGRRQIRAWELAKLAQIYHRDLDYFLSEKEETEGVLVLWRNRRESREVRAYERRFVRFCENYAYVEELSGLKPPRVLEKGKCHKEDFSFSFVENLAGRYLGTLELGRRPACSLARVLDETFAVRILYLEMGGEGSGASAWGRFGPAMLVNADEVPWRGNFSLAHELFHLLTMDIFEVDEIYSPLGEGKSRVEQFADSFASALLLPTDEIRQEVEARIKKRTIAYLDVVEIAREFDVSREALLWRLVRLGFVKSEDASGAVADPEFRTLNRRPPSFGLALASNFPDRYVALAFRCMHLGQISRGKFAEFMEIDRQEIPDFLARYRLDEDRDYTSEFITSRH